MKKVKKLLALCLCAVFISLPVFTETTQAATKAKTSSAPVQNGWYKFGNGDVKYFRNGRYLTGAQRIGNYRYIFSPSGVRVQRNIHYKGILYYIDDYGRIVGWKKGSFCYYSNGRRMSQYKSQEYSAYQNARTVIQSVTTKRMTKGQKLETCFRWVMRVHYGGWRRFDQGGPAWYAVQANDMFERRRGDCIGYAAVFAYIAKALGYQNVYICANAPRSNNHAHAWTEINGRVYDPLYAGTDGYSQNYNVRYGTYRWQTVFRKKLA